METISGLTMGPEDTSLDLKETRKRRCALKSCSIVILIFGLLSILLISLRFMMPMEEEEAPSIIDLHSSTQQLPVGQTARFTCNASGTPEPTVEWLYNGRPLERAGTDDQSEAWVDRGFLFVRGVRSGVNTVCCMASNSAGTDNHTAELLVFVMPTEEEEAPSIIDLHSSTQRLPVGQTARFTCNASGTPEPTVEWLHNGRPLERAGTDDQSEAWVDRGFLFVRGVRSGVNTVCCMASNSAGTANHTAELLVFVMPTEEEEAPSIIDLHSSTERLPVGQTARFTCNASGTPEPTVEWLHNGRPLERAGTDDQSEAWVDRGFLFVRGVRSGVNTVCCMASNSAGTANHTAELPVFVMPTEEEEAPSIIDLHSSTQRLPVGQTARFTCNASGTPEPTVEWLHNGRPLERAGTDDQSEAWVDRGFLFVRGVRSGVNTVCCMASNSAGTANHTAELLVFVMPTEEEEAPSIIDVHSSTQRLPVGQKARFTCNASGTPKPTVEWLHNGRPLKRNGTDDQSEAWVERSFLFVRGVKYGMNTVYCMASNSAGTANHTTELLVFDACELTLDPNTAYRRLSLSEDNRKVTGVGEDQSYPDHAERFDYWPQVLCREALTSRCYWEVEWKERVEIGVTYRGITRRGAGGDSWLGGNNKSWSLLCHDDGYYARYNGRRTVIRLPPAGSHRVGVYLDRPAGTLSFYRVSPGVGGSSDTLTHIHTFRSTFTQEDLLPGFRVWESVSLCRL